MIASPNKRPKKKVAPGKGNATSENKQKKPLSCGNNHISKLRRELQNAGLTLRDTNGRNQCVMLLRVLQYLGSRGINTPEGTGCGYYRIATRVQELEGTGWHISVLKERILGADGLIHKGMARYILIGRRADFIDPQGSLDLGGPA